MSTKANIAPTKLAPTSSIPQGIVSSPEETHQHVIEPKSIESQIVKDEKIQVFCREYAKRIAAATTRRANTKDIYSSKKTGGVREDRRKGQIVWPSRDLLMELYKKLLSDSKDPNIREVLSEQTFAVSSFATNLAEKLEQQLEISRQQKIQKSQCSCGKDHGNHGLSEFHDDSYSYEDEPDDDLDPKIRDILSDRTFAVSGFAMSLTEKSDQRISGGQQQYQKHSSQCSCGKNHEDQGISEFYVDSYEDEPRENDSDDCDLDDDEDYDDEDENDDDIDDDDIDDDDDDDDYDDNDSDDDEGSEDDEDDIDSFDEDEDFEDDSDEDMIPGNKLMELKREEERRMFVSISQLHNDKNILKEKIRMKQLIDAQKKKQEGERIRLLQRLRLEDEERRKKEQQGKERKERLEQEQRRRRETTAADQAARSFLFTSVSKSRIDMVKSIMEASPDSGLSDGIPKFATVSAIRVTGWECISEDVNVKETSGNSRLQETLLHVAARTGSLELVLYLIGKGAPLDALDSGGEIPLHSAAKHNAPLNVCRLLIEKAPYCIDWHSVKSGKTALHHAAQNGNGELVAMLLQHHARVSAVDAEGNTPEMLAKAGLEREKSSKPRAQKYRITIQHIQKSLAAIKEAQRQKDAQLEKQRKKEEELAKEEAEKDMAARKKQEEKLEADQRRREEEEKELERLKALTLDPHGQNTGGGGNKKKKKKKGKAASEVQAVSKEVIPKLADPARSLAVKPTSSSSLISPIIDRSTSSPQTPTLPVASPKVDIFLSNTSFEPRSQPTATNLHSALRSSSISAKASTLSSIQSPTIKIPKSRVNYRPSQLVVARMTDMGFPQQAARKALIQTEGKVEEAIELLTSGAVFEDDSEDEVDISTLQLTQKKVVKDASSISSTTKQDVSAKASILNSTSQPSSQTTPNTQPSITSKPQYTQSSAPALTKKPATHPVQILNRPTVVPPHVQMRAVPTQVLQRPPSHSRIDPNNTSIKPSTHRALSSTQTSKRQVSNPVVSPSITQQPHPFKPSAATPNLSTQYPTLTRSHSTSIDPSALPINHQFDTPQLVDSISLHSFSDFNINKSPSSPSPAQGDFRSNINSHTMQTTSSAGSDVGWSKHPVMQSRSPHSAMNAHQMNLSNKSGRFDNSTWGIPLEGIPSVSEKGTSSFSYQPYSPAMQGFHSMSFSTTDITERLRQSQADMDDDTDSDMIKDVLAMAGAIDRDELESTFTDFPLSDTGDRGSRANSKASVTVGEGRAQTSPRNPVSSLWEYGSFTQEISNTSQSWSSSQPQGYFGTRSSSDGSIGQGFDSWNSGANTVDTYAHPLIYQDTNLHTSSNGQQTHMTSYINSLFGSPQVANATSGVDILSTVTPSTDSNQFHNSKPTLINNKDHLRPSFQQFGIQDGVSAKNIGHEVTQVLPSNDNNYPSYPEEQTSKYYGDLQQAHSTRSSIRSSVALSSARTMPNLYSNRSSISFAGDSRGSYNFNQTAGTNIRKGQFTQASYFVDSSQPSSLDSSLISPTQTPALEPNIASLFRKDVLPDDWNNQQ